MYEIRMPFHSTATFSPSATHWPRGVWVKDLVSRSALANVLTLSLVNATEVHPIIRIILVRFVPTFRVFQFALSID
jgi:hypothetical protein